jgi:hypothetical protein
MTDPANLDNLRTIDRYIDTLWIDTLWEIENYCKKHRSAVAALGLGSTPAELTAQAILDIIDKHWPEPNDMPV